MYRLFELIPGTLAWSTIFAVVYFSYAAPTVVAVFIIAFDTYWFLKSVYLSLHLRVSFRKMRERMKMNWIEELEKLEKKSIPHPNPSRSEKGEGIPSDAPSPYLWGKVGMEDYNWRNIYHLVIFPIAGEPYTVVRESFERLAAVNYPKDRLIVVLATEARIPQGAKRAEHIAKEFSSLFFRFLITAHPPGIVGEIAGKGSNETWAAKEVKRRIIDPLGLPYRRIIVSVFDSDTQVFPEYFGVLTHAFLTCAHPLRSSFQPVPLFTNNVYSSPLIARLIAFSSSFWHLMQQSRPERLTTFSSHAMPFQAVVDVGFWQTDVVSEDSRIFWQCFLHYDGDWRVEPIFYPISMDVSVAPTFWRTLANIYKQQRRWGWGCENISYFLAGFFRNKHIPFRKKMYWGFHYIEGFHSWATNAIIIFTLGWLPIVLGGPEFRVTLLSFNLPRITRTIMTVAMVGIVSSAILSIMILPPKPPWFRRRHYILYAIQWLLTPLTLILFGAAPALDAQTRLMLGGRFRLGFWITPKFRETAQAERGKKKALPSLS